MPGKGKDLPTILVNQEDLLNTQPLLKPLIPGLKQNAFAVRPICILMNIYCAWKFFIE